MLDIVLLTFLGFQCNMQGPNVSYCNTCNYMFDFSNDGDIDLEDFSAYQNGYGCYGGKCGWILIQSSSVP